MSGEDQIVVTYLGDSRKPGKAGFLPGVTPFPGIAAGESVAITPSLCASLRRDSSDQARADFAEFLCAVYNANMPTPRWEFQIARTITETRAPETVQSVEEPDVLPPTPEATVTEGE